MAITTEFKSDETNQLLQVPTAVAGDASFDGETAGNRILMVGATGFMGRFVAEASLAAGYTTYLLVRPDSTNPSKDKIIRGLQDSGAIVIPGRMEDQSCMENILSEFKIDVVISAVGGAGILDQLILVEAIKTVRTVKRFLPSEFGHDIDRAAPVEPGLTMYLEKRKVRRAIEAAGIPYTYICCNSIAAWPYHDNTHPADVLPPLDQFKIYGDGSVKAYFVAGEDIGNFTIKALNDVRTLNKNLHFRPPCNCFNLNEMASLWEKKIKRKLPRFILTEENLLDAAAEMCIPRSIVAALTHDIFINGCQVNFPIDGANDEEIGHLYPDITYRTLDECFDDYLVEIIDQLDQLDPDEEAIATPTALQNMLPETGVIVGLS